MLLVMYRTKQLMFHLRWWNYYVIAYFLFLALHSMASISDDKDKVIPMVAATEDTPFAKGETKTFSSIPDPGDGYKHEVSSSSSCFYTKQCHV